MQKSLRIAAIRHLTLLVAAMGGRLAASAVLMALAGVLEAASLIALVLLVGTLGIDVSAGGAATFALASRRIPRLDRPRHHRSFAVLAIYVAVTVSQAMVLRAQTVLNLGIEYRFIALLRSRLYDAVANAQWLFVAHSRGTDFSHALTTELDRAGLATYQLLWSVSTIFVMAAQVVMALQVSAPLTLLVFAAGGLLASLCLRGFGRHERLAKRSQSDGRRACARHRAPGGHEDGEEPGRRAVEHRRVLAAGECRCATGAGCRATAGQSSRAASNRAPSRSLRCCSSLR